MLKQVQCLLFIVAVITLSSPSVSAQQYRIKLDPLEKAGDKYRLEAVSAETTTIETTVSGQFMRKVEDAVTVELSADVVTLEAASNHWATRKQFKVLSSKLTRAGTTRPVLPDGTEVIVSIQNGQTVYRVNQQLVEEEVAAALRSVISLHLASVADDDMFGTTTRKKIGESWPVGIEAMRKLLQEMGAQGGRQEITGTSTLEKVEDNHIFVRSFIKVQDVLLPIAPDITTEGGELENEFSAKVSLLQKNRTRESSDRIYLSRDGSTVNEAGEKMKLHLVYERKSRYEIRPR